MASKNFGKILVIVGCTAFTGYMMFEPEIKRLISGKTAKAQSTFTPKRVERVMTSQGEVEVNAKNEAHVPPPRPVRAPDYNQVVAQAKLMAQAADQKEMRSFLNARNSGSIRGERISEQYWSARVGALTKELEAERLERTLTNERNGVVESGGPSTASNGMLKPSVSGEYKPSATILDAGISAKPTERSVFVDSFNERTKKVSFTVDGVKYPRVKVGQRFAGFKLESIDGTARCVNLTGTAKKTVCF